MINKTRRKEKIEDRKSAKWEIDRRAQTKNGINTLRKTIGKVQEEAERHGRQVEGRRSLGMGAGIQPSATAALKVKDVGGVLALEIRRRSSGQAVESGGAGGAETGVRLGGRRHAGRVVHQHDFGRFQVEAVGHFLGDGRPHAQHCAVLPHFVGHRVHILFHSVVVVLDFFVVFIVIVAFIVAFIFNCSFVVLVWLPGFSLPAALFLIYIHFIERKRRPRRKRRRG